MKMFYIAKVIAKNMGSIFPGQDNIFICKYYYAVIYVNSYKLIFLSVSLWELLIVSHDAERRLPLMSMYAC